MIDKQSVESLSRYFSCIFGELGFTPSKKDAERFVESTAVLSKFGVGKNTKIIRKCTEDEIQLLYLDYLLYCAVKEFTSKCLGEGHTSFSSVSGGAFAAHVVSLAKLIPTILKTCIIDEVADHERKEAERFLGFAVHDGSLYFVIRGSKQNRKNLSDEDSFDLASWNPAGVTQ
jgi:hypothetical protein